MLLPLRRAMADRRISMFPDLTPDQRREKKRAFEVDFLAKLADASELSKLLDRFVAFKKKAEALDLVVDEVETVAAVETLGIPLGAPLACQLRLGLALFRKSFDEGRRDDFAYKKYSNYSTEEEKPKTMKVLRTSIRGKRILVVDEMIDSGGQFLAACDLIDECGGTFVAGLVEAVCQPSGDASSPPPPERLEKSGYVIKRLDPAGLYLVQRRG
jgi:adenine/guanine phosphoribosyltransferase-like PRPP-binding protein